MDDLAQQVAQLSPEHRREVASVAEAILTSSAANDALRAAQQNVRDVGSELRREEERHLRAIEAGTAQNIRDMERLRAKHARHLEPLAEKEAAAQAAKAESDRRQAALEASADALSVR